MKMNLQFLTIVCAAMIMSCTPIYVPNVLNVPLNSGKGDVHAGLFSGTNGYDLQLCYAVTDHVAVMMNGSYGKKTPDSTSNDYYKHIFGEAGAGYYTKVGETGRFEAFGGMGTGYGSADNNYVFISPQNVFATGYYNRCFIQANFGAVTEAFDGGLSMRGTYVNFFKYTYSSTNYNHSNDQFFLEPVLFGRVGWKYVKFQTQFGFAIPLGNESFDDYQPFIFNVGLTFNMNVLGKNWWDKAK